MGAYEAIGTILATILVSALGWWLSRRDTQRDHAEAERLPSIEAARDAEAYKARELASDTRRVRMRAKDGAPRILGPVPNAPDDPGPGEVPDRSGD